MSSKEDIKEIEKDVVKLYDHAKVANEEMSVVKTTLEIVKNDVGWLKKGFWWLLGGGLIGILTSLANLFK